MCLFIFMIVLENCSFFNKLFCTESSLKRNKVALKIYFFARAFVFHSKYAHNLSTRTFQSCSKFISPFSFFGWKVQTFSVFPNILIKRKYSLTIIIKNVYIPISFLSPWKKNPVRYKISFIKIKFSKEYRDKKSGDSCWKTWNNWKKRNTRNFALLD